MKTYVGGWSVVHKKMVQTKFIYDDEDANVVNGRYWYLDKNGYPCTTQLINGERFLHRLLVRSPPELEIDHKNGDVCDARKENLRVVTHSLNTFAVRLSPNATGYRGVYRHRDGFVAQIRVRGRLISLGRSKTPEEAYGNYLNACIKYFGELPPKKE